MKFVGLALLILGGASLLAGIGAAAGFVAASTGSMAAFLVVGIGMMVLGSALRGTGSAELKMPKLNVQVTTTIRTERVVARNVNGQWSVDVSGDPLSTHDPKIQRQILDQLRQSGQLSNEAYNAVAAKLTPGAAPMATPAPQIPPSA